jgi:hypothetical protein
VAASSPAEFEIRFQTRSKIDLSAAATDKRAVLKDSGVLNICVAAPQDAELSDGKNTITCLKVKPAAKRASDVFVTVLYPGAAPKVTFKNDGAKATLTVGADTLVFTLAGADWALSAVNGKSAAKMSNGTERTLTPFRRADK